MSSMGCMFVCVCEKYILSNSQSFTQQIVFTQKEKEKKEIKLKEKEKEKKFSFS